MASSNVNSAIFVADSPDVFESTDFPCPCVVITTNDQSMLRDYVKSTSTPTISMTFKETILGIKPAPVVASYASKGPSPITPRILKSDMMAPGTLTLAARPSKKPIIQHDVLFSDYSYILGHLMPVLMLQESLHGSKVNTQNETLLL